jgi:hypothetical protein
VGLERHDRILIQRPLIQAWRTVHSGTTSGHGASWFRGTRCGLGRAITVSSLVAHQGYPTVPSPSDAELRRTPPPSPRQDAQRTATFPTVTEDSPGSPRRACVSFVGIAMGRARVVPVDGFPSVPRRPSHVAIGACRPTVVSVRSGLAGRAGGRWRRLRRPVVLTPGGLSSRVRRCPYPGASGRTLVGAPPAQR